VISVRNRYVAGGDEDAFVLRSNPGRRILFLIIAILLFVGFILGFDWSQGMSGQGIGGTIFYFILIAVSLIVASWKQETIFSRKTGTVRFRKQLLLFTLQDDSLPLSEVKAVILQTVRLIKDRVDHARDFQRGGVFSQIMQRRNTFFRLFLESDRGKLLLEDSSDAAGLEDLGTNVSKYLNVPYRTEDI